MDSDSEIGGGSDDFSDVVLDETSTETETNTDNQENTETESVEDTNQTETVTESQKHKLKYNHDDVEVTTEELYTLGQKGMNYDKLQEKLTELQNNPALSKYGKVEEVSKLLGYQTDDELIEALYQTHYERIAEAQGLTPAQIQKEYELSQKEKQLSEKEQTEVQKQKDAEMFNRFTTNFPDAKVEMIKPETWEKVNNGIDLTTAYTQQINNELQEQIKILKQNEENFKKAPINGVSSNGSEMKSEKIFEGFDD